jgi:hypothetical protein
MYYNHTEKKEEEIDKKIENNLIAGELLQPAAVAGVDAQEQVKSRIRSRNVMTRPSGWRHSHSGCSLAVTRSHCTVM